MLRSQSIPLAQLVADRKNPRKVKVDRQAHDELVASIRSHDLLQPLVVEPIVPDATDAGQSGKNGDAKYRVKAGNRRLLALQEIHQDKNPKIPCRVLEPDGNNGEAVALAENFVRQNMHPMDEAEAFSRLAANDGKNPDEVAAQFGVTSRYVRQRMKLASLAGVIKQAFRNGEIDTAAAEAFTVLSTKKQRELWDSLNGNIQHARQVRNLIENEWMDAKLAVFDPGSVSTRYVRTDLFHEQILIQREAFFKHQTAALEQEKQQLLDDGWHQVHIGGPDDLAELNEKGFRTREAEGDPDAETAKALEANYQAYVKLEEQLTKIDEEDDEAEEQVEVIYRGIEELEEQEKVIRDGGTWTFSEATKANGIVLIAMYADGRVDRKFRVPIAGRNGSNKKNPKHGDAGGLTPSSDNDVNGHTGGNPLPTSEQLSDRQMRTSYVHESLVVRQALLNDPHRLKVLQILMLHPHVRPDGVSVQLRRNVVEEHAERTDGFTSPAMDEWNKAFEAFNPMAEHGWSEVEAYEKLIELADKQLDQLLSLLTVRALDTNVLHVTPLVRKLAKELDVNVRADWTPDHDWLNSYRKCQLAHLNGELRGDVYGQSSLSMKKSDLVAGLEKLFARSAEGKVEDAELAERVNSWLPANLTDDVSEED